MDQRSPALKRLKKEYDEIEKEKDELPFQVHPLEDNFLEWHFTLKGPSDSVYQEGLYHGRLQFPSDYPFSPPTLMFLSPSGRFQINAKVCLSVTGFHPEHWQPAWGVRTMLIAIRDHFNVEDKAAIGYVNMSEEDRRQVALASSSFSCSGCGYHGPRPSNPHDEFVRTGLKSTSNESSHAEIFFVLAFIVLIIAYNYYIHS